MCVSDGRFVCVSDGWCVCACGLMVGVCVSGSGDEGRGVDPSQDRPRGRCESQNAREV